MSCDFLHRPKKHVRQRYCEFFFLMFFICYSHWVFNILGFFLLFCFVFCLCPPSHNSIVFQRGRFSNRHAIGPAFEKCQCRRCVEHQQKNPSVQQLLGWTESVFEIFPRCDGWIEPTFEINSSKGN